MSVDNEEGQTGHYYVSGFGSLAAFISSDRDHSTAVYRRFDRLAARDLLYYQSELMRLEKLQDKYDIEDAQDIWCPSPDHKPNIHSYARAWEKLKFAAESNSPSSAGAPNLAAEGTSPSSAGAPSRNVKERWADRMELAMEIRETLKAYREALIQDSTLLALRQPSHQTMTALSGYFNHRDSGSGSFPMLSGASEHLYPSEMTKSQIASSDYVSLSQHHSADLLTAFLTKYCAQLFRLRPPPPPPGTGTGAVIAHLPTQQMAQYSIQRVRVAASFITTLTAALLLFLPIYTLYHTAPAQPAVTLGLIALFTVLFAVAIAVMTGARRAEIFGACAAYAAVLVVFVSGDFVGGGKGDG